MHAFCDDFLMMLLTFLSLTYAVMAVEITVITYACSVVTVLKDIIITILIIICKCSKLIIIILITYACSSG